MVGRKQEQLRVENMELRGERLKQIEVFIYLISAIISDARHVRDMERRRTGTTRAFGIRWSDKVRN